MTKDELRPFRWAIFGTGAVARKFVLGLRALDGAADAVCVASRDPDNARRFAASLGLATACADYQEAADLDVDAIYIATPPALHEEHALLGIRAGKAVLIEKPFAGDADAARRIVSAAQEARVFCMEAMWTRFQPLLGLVKTRIEAGDLGEMRGFDGWFMAANTPDPDTGLFDANRGGGALLHRGIYPLSLSRFLLGPVQALEAVGQIGRTGVDEDCALVVRHDTGAVSTVRASVRAAGPEGAVIYGTRGTLYLQGPIWRPTGVTMTKTSPAGSASSGPRRFESFRESRSGLRLSQGMGRLKGLAGWKQTRLRAPFAGNGYHYQAEAVMQAVRAGAYEDARMPLSESLEVMDAMTTARAAMAAGARI